MCVCVLALACRLVCMLMSHPSAKKVIESHLKECVWLLCLYAPSGLSCEDVASAYVRDLATDGLHKHV